ncbi:anaerobic ribonucleoside-triphosphate reductase activating protein [Sporanaerobacter acetigenes]|uniref:Anaerobic ribonucleoside-triphosphate reductase-activating protein n=1 Tax=Sporanaerobacter acetigenes DSM 13106 TaxID=1123281 RepID=A0A1M5WIX4_9FIRM|nr:anaerobic ribonucleoside-triphosphate reductase activating protein [Sporanaerobacter acetigenes]SHH87174.1 anaerobic ribonucleoside-triphosphate reductase activating protein [Sporanaerobacter acetigenes DSM 13106]
MSTYLRIAGIEKESIVDGPGIRLTVFSQGCKHHCLGCHNPQTHSFEGGQIIDIENILDMIKKNPLLDGITFSGGDPFEQAESFAVLGGKVKAMGLNVMSYTGYTYEEILEGMDKRPEWKELLYVTDILVDGPFDINKKSMMLKFKGSSNQRIIDVKESLTSNEVVIFD